MTKDVKDIIIGSSVALFATLAGVFLYIELFSRYAFEESLEMIERGGLQAEVLTLGAVPNLFVFFVYIKKKEDKKAQGVLLFTMLVALLVFILKLS